MRVQVTEQSTQGQVTLRHDHPELGEQPTDPIADGQRLDFVTLAYSMPAQSHLLVDRLDRHKAHVSLTRRRGNGLGIGAIVLGLGPLAEGLHELGRDDPRLKPILQATPRPMVRAAAKRILQNG